MTNTGEIVGKRLRKVRILAHESQADAARRLGWTQGSVSGIEAGRKSRITVDELLMLSAGYDVPLASWFADVDEDVELNGTHTMAPEDVRDWLSGNRVASVWVDFSNVVDYSVDERIAERLNRSQADIADTARRLWGHHATAERDRRVTEKYPDITDPRELRTIRAAETKRLTAEIELQS